MKTQTTRRGFLKALGVLGLATAFGRWSEMAQATDPTPNFIFIYTDDMGFGDLGCYGNTNGFTPNIDNLAQEGLRFTQFYVMSPVCSPSRVAVTTGMYPARWQIHTYLQSKDRNRKVGQADYLDPQAPSLARLLHKSGYATGHFGKWHMGGGRDVHDAPLPSAYGFDEHRVNAEGLGPRFPKVPGNSAFAISNDDLVDTTIDFIKRHSEKPFYVNFWPSDVHTPHVPSTELKRKYNRFSSDPAKQKFYAVLEGYDQQIGRLIAAVDELGLAENTLILFTSDNGPNPSFYQERTGGLRGGKGSLYEGGVRMPFIARWPGTVPAGSTNSATVLSGLDLLPSLCALAGVPVLRDRAFDGEELSQAFFGFSAARSRPLMWEYGHGLGFPEPGSILQRSPALAIREGQWKLLMEKDGSDVQLYNLEQDPKELTNLTSAEPEVTKRLKESVMNWFRSLP